MKPVRSLLYIPANRREWVESAPENAADGYIFDLEDAVPLDEREHAREVLAEALAAFVDEESAITARINPPDTGLFEADLEAIVRPGLDAVVVPKLPSPTELERTDHVLSYLESVRGIDDRIEIIALPETAQGFRRCYDLCTASERVAAIVSHREVVLGPRSVIREVEVETRLRRCTLHLIAEPQHERADDCGEDDGDRHHQDDPDDRRYRVVVCE